jgi:hypothetical protein
MAAVSRRQFAVGMKLSPKYLIFLSLDVEAASLARYLSRRGTPSWRRVEEV